MKATHVRSCVLILLTAVSTAFAAEMKYAPLDYQPLCCTGQALTDMEVAKHHEIKILTLHVTPKGVPADTNSERRLFFSNIGRVSKLDAGQDAAVYESNQELIEQEDDPTPASMNFNITATPKYEVLEILRNRNGERIGLIVFVFPFHKGFDHEQYHRIALEVAKDLASRISDKDSLFDPA